jgi:RHS repeat-associated protein
MPDVEYRYDTVTHGLGKPASVSNGLVTTRYTEYSPVGELLQSQQEFDGVAAPYTFHYAYNMAGQMVTETYPSGRVVMNTFDSEGKVDSVSSRGAGHAPHIFANGFHYNDKGTMDRLRLGNGLWEGLTANNRFQTTQVTLGTSSGGSELLKLDYNYGSNTNNGNVLSQTITVPTIGSATGFVTTQAYTYDALNRLASVAEKQYGQETPDWQQQFGYDPYGNRAMGTGSTQTFGRNSTETQSLIGPDPTVSASTNRITNKTGEHYEFDASGNMTKDALGNRSVYDIANHQIEYFYAANTGSLPDAKYYYDGDGKRIKKVVGTETTVFVYDAAGKMVAEYTLGITAPSNPQSNYITTDMLGSTRLVTNGAGQVVARHDYLPFGDEIYGLGGRTSTQGFAQPDTTRKRFTGYEHDTESGFDFAQARYYGNGLGRFTSVDPYNIVFETESAAARHPKEAKAKFISYLRKPCNWNKFSYVANNPLKFTDPTGEKIQLTGSAIEQQKKLERITRMLGPERMKYVTFSQVCNPQCVTTLSVDSFDNFLGIFRVADTDLAAQFSAHMAVLLATPEVVEYHLTDSDTYQDKNGTHDISKMGGAVTLGKDLSISGNIQIIVSTNAVATAQEEMRKGINGFKWTGRQFDFEDDIIDAHEFGHAWGALVFWTLDSGSPSSAEGNQGAVDSENYVRERRQMNQRRVRD